MRLRWYIAVGTLSVAAFLAVAPQYLRSRYGYEQEFDAGVVLRARQVTHSFQIFNGSLYALAIGHPASSCGCTVVGELPASVPPLGFLTVPVEVGLEAKQGEFSSTISIPLGESGAAVLEIRGRVIHEVPGQVLAGKLTPGEVARIYVLPEGGAVAPGVLHQDDILEVSAYREEGIDADLLSIKVLPEAPYGYFERSLELASDTLGSGAGSVNIAGVVRGDVETAPDQVSLGYISKLTDWSAPLGAVSVKSPTDKTVEVELKRSRIPSYLRVALEPSPQERNRVRFYLAEGPPHPGIIRDRAVLGIQLDGYETEISVPIIGYVLENFYESAPAPPAETP